VKYLFDNCISFRYAAMLGALGVDAEPLRQNFAQDIQDVALFKEMKGSRLVFVTADTRQVTRRQEAIALKECGITAIFFGRFWSKLDFWQQAAWLVTKWPRISGFSENVTLGTCAEIKQNGAANVFAL